MNSTSFISICIKHAKAPNARRVANADMERALREIGVTDVAQLKDAVKTQLPDQALEQMSGGIFPANESNPWTIWTDGRIRGRPRSRDDDDKRGRRG